MGNFYICITVFVKRGRFSKEAREGNKRFLYIYHIICKRGRFSKEASERNKRFLYICHYICEQENLQCV